MAGAAAGLDLVDLIPRESRMSGDGFMVHLRKPSGEDRLRTAVRPNPLRLGVGKDALTYPELSQAMERGALALLRDRGEPAGIGRITAAVLMELQRSGLLARIVAVRGRDGEETDAGERLDGSGPVILAQLLREELWRE